MPRVKVIFRWFDIWVGLFIDMANKKLYIFGVPMLGVCVEWGRRSEQ